MKKFIPTVVLLGVVIIFFRSFFLHGLLPIPSDDIVGVYHPYRDFYATTFPRGIQFKNFLVTDPVRQQYPWRYLAVELEKNFQLPLWNPYNFSGAPLLANNQSAVFYPLNIVFFIFPFSFAWSLLIFLEPFLAGMFMFFYLQNKKINIFASSIASVAFAFSGFMVAWLEWGTLVHALLWLPLLLLCIDKIFFYFKVDSKLRFKNKKLLWAVIFVFSVTSSFLAGHLQTFFYVICVTALYILGKWFFNVRQINRLFFFILLFVVFIVLTSFVWIPTLQFILLSARGVDPILFDKAGLFLPWQNLAQFIAPDFFGNPSTQNYYGIWNYGEFIGYIGIFPLIMTLYATIHRRERLIYFFSVLTVLSLGFSLPTFLAKIPFLLNVPFIATSQPTRLLAITDFSLCILAAFGIDYFIKTKKTIFVPYALMSMCFFALWIVSFFGTNLGLHISSSDIAVSKHNLYFPTALFIIYSVLLWNYLLLKHKKAQQIILVFLLLLTIFDVLRFAQKYSPFASGNFLYPSTQTTQFLKNHLGNYRYMSLDTRILPSNFSIMYRLQDIEGYDPIYLRQYGEYIVASNRDKPDITPPFNFYKSIATDLYKSKLIDLLGVKYMVSYYQIFNSAKLVKVFQEGQTNIYENKDVLPRTFFVKNVITVNGKQNVLNKLFAKTTNLFDTAVIENYNGRMQFYSGVANILSYQLNDVVIATADDGVGFLVLTDTYYPTWHVAIDNIPATIYKTDYNFRGIIVPAGNHTIYFYDKLF